MLLFSFLVNLLFPETKTTISAVDPFSSSFMPFPPRDPIPQVKHRLFLVREQKAHRKSRGSIPEDLCLLLFQPFSVLLLR